MTGRRVRQRILRLEVLGPEGSTTTEHRVYCRLRRHGVLVETCCACVHCDAVRASPEPVVECTVPALPAPEVGEDAGRFSGVETSDVGTLLTGGTVVVARSATVGDALALLRSGERHAVVIVDEKDVLVGVVHEGPGVGPLRRLGDAPVAAVMSSAVVIDERTSIPNALRVLAANHLREAPVVTAEGVPLGIFRDVDGLHWLYEARARQPP